MQAALGENVFVKPWKSSDPVLVVRGTEFNVHRSTLSLQSPVFEAMLNGSFKEADQEKIDLEEDPDEMLNFLKFLYPYKMFLCVLYHGNYLAMLKLADKYQTESMIKLCFEQSERLLKPSNVFQVLPLAQKYDQNVFEKCISLAQKNVPCKDLNDILPDLDRSQAEKIWSGKCLLLENVVKQAEEYLVTCLAKLWSHDYASDPYQSLACPEYHEVNINNFRAARECNTCLSIYRTSFCSFVSEKSKEQEVAMGSTCEFTELLKNIDDVLLHVRK